MSFNDSFVIVVEDPLRFSDLFILGYCISCFYSNKGVTANCRMFVPAEAKSSVIKKNCLTICMKVKKSSYMQNYLKKH